MTCIKCSAEIPENSIYCNICGAKQQKAPHGTKKRGNGQGSVYKSPAGTWTAKITLGFYTHDGVRKRKRKRKYGFEKKKDALAYILAMQNGIEERKSITVAILWEQFRQQLDSLSKSKRTAYNIAWRKIGKDIEYRSIDEFTVPELQEITDRHGTSYYTKRDIKNLLPELNTEERVVMTDAEITQLWNDYHQNKHRITAHKKGKNRKIIIPDRMVPVLEMMIAEDKDKIAHYSCADDFYDAWKAKRTKLGIREAIAPYCCRHTYVTKLTALKVSPAMLQELAGHEDYDTTLEYTHLSVADRLAEVNRL